MVMVLVMVEVMVMMMMTGVVSFCLFSGPLRVALSLASQPPGPATPDWSRGGTLWDCCLLVKEEALL